MNSFFIIKIDLFVYSKFINTIKLDIKSVLKMCKVVSPRINQQNPAAVKKLFKNDENVVNRNKKKNQ